MASDTDADFFMVLSSEMIAEIVEQHLNKSVYKKKVKIVETSPSQAGYTFGLVFINNVQVHQPVSSIVQNGTHQRDTKGRYRKAIQGVTNE